MKLIAGTTIAITALTSLAMIQSAEARCFWNGFDMECHYPAPPPTAFREIYREVVPLYEPPRVVHREVIERGFEAPPVIYQEGW